VVIQHTHSTWTLLKATCCGPCIGPSSGLSLQVGGDYTARVFLKRWFITGSSRSRFVVQSCLYTTGMSQLKIIGVCLSFTKCKDGQIRQQWHKYEMWDNGTLVEILKGRDHIGYLGLYARIILEWIVIVLSVPSSRWTWSWSFQLPTRRGISWPVEWQLASQEGCCPLLHGDGK
jgi:hypothetical protein